MAEVRVLPNPFSGIPVIACDSVPAGIVVVAENLVFGNPADIQGSIRNAKFDPVEARERQFAWDMMRASARRQEKLDRWERLRTVHPSRWILRGGR